MFDILMAIVFAFIAVRTFASIYKERAVFREFDQSLVLLPLVVLYPVSNLAAGIAGLWLPGVVTWSLAGVVFLCAWLVARKQAAAFQRAGTSRVAPAEEAVSNAAGFAVLGLGLIVLRIVVVYVVSSIHAG